MRRNARLGVLTTVALALVPLPAAGVEGSVPAASSAGAPRAIAQQPGFTSPLWLPLRRPAKVSCVKTNCRPYGEPNHGHWAIDFLGSRNDPVFAAGYGVAHVGGRFSGCARSSQPRGNWVWVDHGAGEITAYTHLGSIVVREGQRVTPASLLGRMGRSGTCGPNYLHFERRMGGIHGRYVYPLSGAVCIRARQRTYPGAAGYRNWNSMPIKPRRVTVWSEGVGCSYAPRPVATPPGLRVVKRWPNAAKVAWRTVPGGPNYAISVRKYQRTTGQWGATRFRYTKRTQMIVRGLSPNTPYWVQVAASRGGANSGWSWPRTVGPLPR